MSGRGGAELCADSGRKRRLTASDHPPDGGRIGRALLVDAVDGGAAGVEQAHAGVLLGRGLDHIVGRLAQRVAQELHVRVDGGVCGRGTGEPTGNVVRSRSVEGDPVQVGVFDDDLSLRRF